MLDLFNKHVYVELPFQKHERDVHERRILELDGNP